MFLRGEESWRLGDHPGFPGTVNRHRPTLWVSLPPSSAIGTTDTLVCSYSRELHPAEDSSVSHAELVKKRCLSQAAAAGLAPLCVESSKEDKKGLSVSLLSAAPRKHASCSTQTLPVYLKKRPGFMSPLFFQFSLLCCQPAYRVAQCSTGLRPEWETSFLPGSLKLHCPS